MKSHKIIVTTLATVTLSLFLAVRCGRVQSSFTVKGQLIGFDGKMVYLEKGDGDHRMIIDSAELTTAGKFEIKVKDAEHDLSLYELRSGWDRVPILACSGDNIDITSIGRLSYNYSIEGSKESELLRTFYQPYVRKKDELRQIATAYADLQSRGEDSSMLAKDYNTLYNDIKREQLTFIISNKGNIAAIYAIFQRLPGDSFLINETSDLIYMRTVADSISNSYPKSALLALLQDEIRVAEEHNRLINSITYSNFPDINMEDMFGKKHRLSDLTGSVILVDFWSAGLGNSNPNNANLKEIYKEYKGDGFEVYQVGVDTSKSVWVNAVQNQRLPWISVSDLLGGNSPVIGLYNITNIPSNILISKSGEIVGRNLYGDALRDAVARESKVTIE